MTTLKDLDTFYYCEDYGEESYQTSLGSDTVEDVEFADYLKKSDVETLLKDRIDIGETCCHLNKDKKICNFHEGEKLCNHSGYSCMSFKPIKTKEVTEEIQQILGEPKQ